MSDLHDLESRTVARQDVGPPFERGRRLPERSRVVLQMFPHMYRLPGATKVSEGDGMHNLQHTLNSVIIGKTSSDNASFVTSPPLRSILFPTSITGTCVEPSSSEV